MTTHDEPMTEGNFDLPASGDHTSDAPPVVGERSRIDRRTAMKAALGGAAAAAVWSAPRIEGLSMAPELAQAASCTGGVSNQSHNSNDCGYYGDTECWGNSCCGTFNIASTAVPGGAGFTYSASISGDVNGDNGNFTVTMGSGGWNPPFRRCVVTAGGNCNNGGTFRFRNGVSSTTFTSAGSIAFQPDCQGNNGTDPNGTLNLSVSCVCL